MIRTMVVALGLAAAPAMVSAQQANCRGFNECVELAARALAQAASGVNQDRQRIDDLQARVDRLERAVQAERSNVLYTLSMTSNCPGGWSSMGQVGMLWRNSNGRAPTSGASYNDNYSWFHPYLCRR